METIQSLSGICRLDDSNDHTNERDIYDFRWTRCVKEWWWSRKYTDVAKKPILRGDGTKNQIRPK